MKTTDIIIPVWNQSELTINCLKSLRDTLQRHEYRVILVDNGSNPDEKIKVIGELLEHEHIYIQNKENEGFVKAVNKGIKASSNNVVLLNNDTVVVKGWLQYMQRILDDNKGVGIVGCMTDAGSYQNWVNCRNHGWDVPDYTIPEKTDTTLYLGAFHRVAMCAFFGVLIRKEVIDSIGGLDERFGVGFADDDHYCHLVRKHGWEVVVATGAFIHHYHRSTFKKLYTQDEIDEMTTYNINLYRELTKE